MKIFSIWIFIHISSAKVFIISGSNHSKSYSSNIGVSASGDVKDTIIVEGKPELLHLNEAKNPIVSLRPREQRNGMLGIYFNPNDPLSRLAALWWGKVFEKPFPTLVTRPATHGNVGKHPRPRPPSPVTTISNSTPTPSTPPTIQNASASTNETAEILPPATTETTETTEVSVSTVAVPAGPVGPVNMSMSMMPNPPYFPINMNPSIPMSVTMPIQMQMWPMYPLPQPGLLSPNQPMTMIMPPLSVIPYPGPPGTQFQQTQYPGHGGNIMPPRPPNLPLTPNPNPNPNPTNPGSPNQQTFPGPGSGQIQPGQQGQKPNFPSGQLGGQGQPGSGLVNPPGQQNTQTQQGQQNQPGRPNFPNPGQFPNQPGPGQPNRPIQPGPGQPGALQPNPGQQNFQSGPSQSNFQGQMMWMQGGFPNQQGQLNQNLQKPPQQSPGYKPQQPIQPPQQNQQPGQGLFSPHIKDTDQDLPNNEVENVKPPLPSPDSDVVVTPAPFENIPFPILSGNHNLNLNYAHSFTYQKQSEDVRESRPFYLETSGEPPFLEDGGDLNLQKLSTTERPQLEEDNPISEKLNLTDININTDVAQLPSVVGTDAPESTTNQSGEEIKISTDVQNLIRLTTQQRTSSRGNFNDVRFIPLHSMLVVWRPNTSMTGNKNMFLSRNVKVPPFSDFTGNNQKY